MSEGPYAASELLRLLEAYNAWLWPAQLPALALGAWLTWVAWRGTATQFRVALGLLGLVWLWIAWALLDQRLAPLDPAAPYGAYGSAIEGGLLIALATRFGADLGGASSLRRLIGAGFVDTSVTVLPFAAPLFAMVLSADGDPHWRAAAVFGVTPDATALATLGLVVALGRHRWLAVIPLLWCLQSGAMLWELGFGHAWVSPVLAAGALVVLLWDAAPRSTRNM